MTNHTHDIIALTSDPVILIDFYTANPKILLVKRGIEPFKGKLVFAGGHFEPGIFNPKTESYEGGDDSLAHTTSREAEEEAGLIWPWHKWKLYTILDHPNRDPRSDCRRISICLSAHLESSNPEHKKLIANLHAGDDAAEVHLMPLMDLKKNDMGFDHWIVIEMLQSEWKLVKTIWKFNHSVNDNEHHCKSKPSNWQIRWYKATKSGELKVTTLADNDSTIISNYARIKHCPFCGADLTIPPIPSPVEED